MPRKSSRISNYFVCCNEKEFLRFITTFVMDSDFHEWFNLNQNEFIWNEDHPVYFDEILDYWKEYSKKYDH